MNQVPLFVAIPLGAAFLIPLFGMWWKKSGELLATLATLLLAAMAVMAIGSPAAVHHMGGWTAPLGIALVSDGLTVLLLLAVMAGFEEEKLLVESSTAPRVLRVTDMVVGVLPSEARKSVEEHYAKLREQWDAARERQKGQENEDEAVSAPAEDRLALFTQGA